MPLKDKEARREYHKVSYRKKHPKGSKRPWGEGLCAVCRRYGLETPAQDSHGYCRVHAIETASARNHRNPWSYLMHSARARAKAKNLPFDLTLEWALDRWTGACEVSGLPFVQSNKRGPSVFSPSIDRVNAALGYVQSNCRFVIMGVNGLRGTGTDDDMLLIAHAIVKKFNDVK